MVVVGGGVTGLATAFHLTRGGLRVVVLEAAPRCGGVMRSEIVDRPEGRWICEQGPNTVLGGRPAVERLIHRSGLAGKRLLADRAARRRFILQDGRLVALPAGPGSALTTPLLPATAKLRLLREPFAGRAVAGEDESLADFVRRRFGPAVLERVVGPFVSGVWAGDPERLSARWAMPRLVEMEAEHGSLLRAGLARLVGRRHRAQVAESGTAGEPLRHRERRPSRLPFSFADGLATLPRWLAEALDVRRGVAAIGVRREQGTLVVETGGGRFSAPRVVAAVPARTAAALVAGGPVDAAPLAALPHASVAVASYGFRREAIGHPLDGFGFLVPRGERLRLVGCLFPSSLFPGRAPAGHVLLTAFLGGRTDPAAVELDDDLLHRLALADLDHTLGIYEEPVLRNLTRWRDGIPQYERGHGRFLALAEEIERSLPGLHLAGSWRGGVSVPDRIERAEQLATALLRG